MLRSALTLLAAAAALSLNILASSPALAAPPPVTLRTVVASGLEWPVAIANAGDGSGRLFVVEQNGRIRVVKNGALLSTPFLDITSRVLSTGNEQGLLGLAFHPQYAANRKFYVFYTREPVAGNAGSWVLQVSEFLANAANPDLADAGSERRVIAIPHPFNSNHNGGQLAFGPEGYLYISTGDGGGGGDPGENAENIDSLLGKLLRIDVNGDDFPADAQRNYAVPPTNPFVGVAGADEIWAYGLRNPWRFSFDRLTGDIYVGDVGQLRREEINFEPAGGAGGLNYGWDIMEGSLCYEPMAGCNTSGKVLPVIEHTASSGWHAIIGGYVYRGRKSAALRGFYIYTDFYILDLYAASPNGAGGWDDFVSTRHGGSVACIGEDESGELYVAKYGSSGSLLAIDGPNDPLPPRKRGDLSGDNRADVLWRNAATGENYAFFMNGTTIESEGYVRPMADLAWKVIGIGDFYDAGNGKADILWQHTGTGEIYMFAMDGTNVVAEGHVRTVADPNWTVAGVGDFNGDGRDDILWRNRVSGENYIYPMNGLAILPTEGYIRTVASQDWQVAGVGDFDGDGKSDILWRNQVSGENYIYPMLGVAIKPTEGYVRTVSDLNWQVAGVGDFNGDGKDDIVWRNSSTGETYVYLMTGNAIAGEGYLRTVADQGWQIAQIGDFDGDGKSDILWRHSGSGDNYLYPMDGTTIKPTEYWVRTVDDQNWQIVGP
jgi:glucose/arabinose dehydrogenase